LSVEYWIVPAAPVIDPTATNSAGVVVPTSTTVAPRVEKVADPTPREVVVIVPVLSKLSLGANTFTCDDTFIIDAIVLWNTPLVPTYDPVEIIIVKNELTLALPVPVMEPEESCVVLKEPTLADPPDVIDPVETKLAPKELSWKL